MMEHEKDSGDLPRWKQDFPVDLPQDEYVSRRDFTKFLMLISLAFVVGQLWILVLNWKRKRKGELPLMEIPGSGKLPVGGSLTFEYPTSHQPCVLVRTGENAYVAYSQKCTHLSCPVIPKPEEKLLRCPCHEGAFDLASGQPVAGPPRRPLTRIRLEFRNGRIYAAGTEGEA